MKYRPLYITFTILAGFTFVGGCGASGPARTGFLSDYSKLERRSGKSFRYLAPRNRLGEYDRFIIDPIKVYYHGEMGEMAQTQVSELTNYLYDALVNAISDRYGVVSAPGGGTARVRVALTDVRRSTRWMNIHPGSKLSGAGTRQAAMEGELIDSVTGEWLAALIQSQRGSQFELDTFSELNNNIPVNATLHQFCYSYKYSKTHQVQF